MKCNPENSILKINAVHCVYVELCYKNFTSKYKNSNYNIDLSSIYDLPFDVIFSFFSFGPASKVPKLTHYGMV